MNNEQHSTQQEPDPGKPTDPEKPWNPSDPGPTDPNPIHDPIPGEPDPYPVTDPVPGEPSPVPGPPEPIPEYPPDVTYRAAALQQLEHREQRYDRYHEPQYHALEQRPVAEFFQGLT